ncbi:MAG TPA: GNAT family N-acetyltransferase [Steroidobacteraceae bacterium]|nr:GNAT family N-acetyltransferase [Steroidobacteraceae bacterium]
MYTLRAATIADIPQLQPLIARSIRQLGLGDYTAEQIEAALQGAFGVDTQLIHDGTYYLVEPAVEMAAPAGCGGWSRRRTLFGGDAHAQRDAAELDPATEAARIRAFFVDPGHARRGIGSMLLRHCETEAARYGFRSMALMATLPGMRLYAAHGYQAGERVLHPLGDRLSIEFVPMTRQLPR